jgi:TrmH family RNA methyltransferase
MTLSREKAKQITQLKTKKGRETQRRFLIEGARLCEEAVKSAWKIELLLYTEKAEKNLRIKSILANAGKREIELLQTKDNIINRVSDTVTSQGIIGVAKIKDFSKDWLFQRKPELLLALDTVKDPGNMGTLIRTADAFGVDGVILSRECVDLFNPKVVRSTMGSIFHIPIIRDVDLHYFLSDLKRKNFKILITELKQGKRLDTLDSSGKICLVMGSEPEGVSRNLIQLADHLVKIPVWGKAESLNVAVACGILLYEMVVKTNRKT